MTRSVRAAALRSTALATVLALVGRRWRCRPRPSKGAAAKAAADRAQCRARDDVGDRARDAARTPTRAPLRSRQTAHAPAAAPHRLRRRGSRPAVTRKPVTPAAVAATSTTSQADKDALENVIELLRKRKPDDATQAEAAISDPVARKLAEWLILRSDNNNVTVERYRAFIVGQSELAVADLPAPAARSSAVGRQARRRCDLVVVRKRIPDLGQGPAGAGQSDDRRAATAAMPSGWCARPGATIRCRRIPKAARSTCSARS